MLRLSGKWAVQVFGRFLSRCYGVGFVFVDAEVAVDRVRLNERLPFLCGFVPVHAAMSRCVVGSTIRIVYILRASGFPQVFKFVVSSWFSSVVDVVFWPLASNYDPRKSVCRVSFSANQRDQITIFVDRAEFFTGIAGVPPLSNIGTVFPAQDSCTRVVFEKRAYKFGAEIVARLVGTCFLGGSHSTLHRSFRSEAGLSASNARLPRLYATSV